MVIWKVSLELQSKKFGSSAPHVRRTDLASSIMMSCSSNQQFFLQKGLQNAKEKSSKKAHHRIHVLAHEAKKVNVLSDELVVGLARHEVLLSTLLLPNINQMPCKNSMGHRSNCTNLSIRLGSDQCNVHIKVVGVLDASYKLLELILKVLPAPLRHHEVMLHGDGETVADSVPGIRTLGLRKGARSRLVWHPAHSQCKFHEVSQSITM